MRVVALGTLVLHGLSSTSVQPCDRGSAFNPGHSAEPRVSARKLGPKNVRGTFVQPAEGNQGLDATENTAGSRGGET